MKDIIEIAKSLEDSGLLLLKVVSKTTKNEAKEQKGGFLTLGTSLLENNLAEKGMNRTGVGIIRAGYGKKKTTTKNKNNF